MDRVLKLVDEQVYSTEIKEQKLIEYMKQITIWNFARIPKEKFLYFQEENSSLVQIYYNTVKASFADRSTLTVSPCVTQFHCLSHGLMEAS